MHFTTNCSGKDVELESKTRKSSKPEIKNKVLGYFYNSLF